MIRALTRFLDKLFPKRRKRKSAAAPPPPAQGQATPVNEEEIRKRLEGLGYIE